MSSISRAAAWVGGATFLVLCFYITIDVLGRRYGGPYSGVTDEISGYVLAIAGTLGLAHAMRVGAHVRIDLLLPRFSPAVIGPHQSRCCERRINSQADGFLLALQSVAMVLKAS